MRQGAVRGGVSGPAARVMPRTAARGAAAPRRPRRRRLPRHVRYAAWWSIPLVIAAGCYGVGVASRMPAVAAALAAAADRLVTVSAICGLVVADIEVEGRETTDAATIMAALGAARGTPILAVNPSRAKEQLEALPWVRSAAIERRLPGTLFVRLVERKPLAVWQHDGKQELIDRDGTVIPVTDLSRFAKLPTVVGGDDARHGAASLVELLASEADLAARVTAIVLVGDRRWNVRIDNAIDVLLPEDDAAGAWSKLARLERTSQVLQRDVQTVDLRLPDRLVMRVSDPAKDPSPTKKTHPGGKST